MADTDEIINDLGQIEISHYGLIHFLRALRHQNEEPERSRSELIAASFLISRAALDAGMGIAVGYALPSENIYRLLGLRPTQYSGDKIPLGVLPFALHDAPCYRSCDFFNWVGYPMTLGRYFEKIRCSLEKFRRFAGTVLQHDLVSSVEFRFTEFDEYGVKLMEIECPVDDMVERILKKISDPLDVPAMQVFVRR